MEWVRDGKKGRVGYVLYYTIYTADERGIHAVEIVHFIWTFSCLLWVVHLVCALRRYPLASDRVACKMFVIGHRERLVCLEAV